MSLISHFRDIINLPPEYFRKLLGYYKKYAKATVAKRSRRLAGESDNDDDEDKQPTKVQSTRPVRKKKRIDSEEEENEDEEKEEMTTVLQTGEDEDSVVTRMSIRCGPWTTSLIL